MSETKTREAPTARPKGYGRGMPQEKVDRVRIIDQIPETDLRVKAMLVEGWSEWEIATRCQVNRARVSRMRNLIKFTDDTSNIISYLEELFAKNIPEKYNPDMREIGEISEILSGWDSKAVSKLAEDLRSGKLAQHYAAAAEPAKTNDRSSPPDGQLYAHRPDRKETAPQFIERVYGGAGWLTGEFTRADLRKVDPQAAAALNNWESHSKQRANLNLPTVKERNDLLLNAGVSRDAISWQEAGRLAAAARRRGTIIK